MSEFDDALARIVAAVVRADARGERLAPAALALLLRQYVATGRDDIAAAVGRGLAHALEAPDLAWLELFAEAAPLTEDDRLPAAALAISTRLCHDWPSRGVVAAAMRSVGACLSASAIIETSARAALIPAAVDELERIVGRVYRPGEALAHSLDGPDEDDGDLGDHVETAAALLTAHAITDRLSYSMLAEELMQRALRSASDVVSPQDFPDRCGMARVLCRLAALHGDDEYRETAIIANQSDYAAAAERILASLSAQCGERGEAAAIYGLALDEWLRVTRQMQ